MSRHNLPGQEPREPREPASERIGRSGIKGQGPFMYIFLEIEGVSVRNARFETYGCPSALRCGDWLTKWAVGRELSTLHVITPADLTIVVGGLPLGKEHCADMAVEALREAASSTFEVCPSGKP